MINTIVLLTDSRNSGTNSVLDIFTTALNISVFTNDGALQLASVGSCATRITRLIFVYTIMSFIHSLLNDTVSN
jgi:hypothetical protein